MNNSLKQKILIVEDDPILRQGLEILGDWEENGLHLIGSASNGKEALAHMETECPDIIITDIMMPVMDGVALIEKVKETYPQTEVIVLSNYSDFQYVKKAMKAGAADYLLKAQIDFNSLLEVVNKLRDSIAQRKQNDGNVDIDEKERERRAFFKRLLFDASVNEEDALKNVERLEIPWKGDYAVCTVDFYKGSRELRGEEKLLLLKKMGSFLEEAKTGLLGLQESGGRLFAVAPWQKGLAEKLRMILYDVSAEEDEITFRLSVGQRVSHPTMLSVSRAVSEEGIAYCFYLGDNSCFDCNESRMEGMQWSVNGEKLRYACMVNNMQEIMGIADDLLAAAVENGYMEPYNLFKSAEGILHILMVNLRREEESSSERLKKMQYFRELGACRDYEGFCISFRRMIRELTGMDEQEYIRSANPLFMEIYEYVNAHIGEELTLKMLSENYHVNYSYLSQMFKSHTGENFSSYLNRQRIQKAAELLKQGRYSVADVGDMVGYHEVSYFCRVFRRLTGKTPSDIQKEPKKV